MNGSKICPISLDALQGRLVEEISSTEYRFRVLAAKKKPIWMNGTVAEISATNLPRVKLYPGLLQPKDAHKPSLAVGGNCTPYTCTLGWACMCYQWREREEKAAARLLWQQLFSKGLGVEIQPPRSFSSLRSSVGRVESPPNTLDSSSPT